MWDVLLDNGKDHDHRAAFSNSTLWMKLALCMKLSKVLAWHDLSCFYWLAQLDMEDGDEIDAMLHQTGGWTCWFLPSVAVVLNVLYIYSGTIFWRRNPFVVHIINAIAKPICVMDVLKVLLVQLPAGLGNLGAEKISMWEATVLLVCWQWRIIMQVGGASQLTLRLPQWHVRSFLGVKVGRCSLLLQLFRFLTGLWATRLLETGRTQTCLE